jgi:hypothetical protein
MTDQPTRPSDETRAAERDDAQRSAGADRQPSQDEEKRAEQHDLDPEVVEHEQEMADRGAKQKGEGRLP